MKKLILILAVALSVTLVLSLAAVAAGGSATGGAGASTGGELSLIDPDATEDLPMDPDPNNSGEVIVDRDLAPLLGKSTTNIYFGRHPIDHQAKVALPQVNPNGGAAKPLGIIVGNTEDMYAGWSIMLGASDFVLKDTTTSAFNDWWIDMVASKEHGASVPSTGTGDVVVESHVYNSAANIGTSLSITSGNLKMAYCNRVNAGYWNPTWQAYLSTGADIKAGEHTAVLTWTLSYEPPIEP